MAPVHSKVAAAAASTQQSPSSLTAIEYLEGQNVKIALRDSTMLQGRLARIGWMSPDSEAISYLCLHTDSEASYVLAAQGISTGSGVVFIPWDWVAYLVTP